MVRFEHVLRPRYWIADLDEGVRLARSRQRANRRQCDFFAKPAHAVSIQIRLRLPRNAVAIRQGLRCFRSRDRAKRRSFHHFATVQSAAKAEQLNVILKEGSAFPNRNCPRLADRAALDHYRPRLAPHRLAMDC